MVDNSWGMVHWGMVHWVSMVDKGSVVDRGMVDKGDMVDTVGNMVDTVGNMVGSIEIRVMGSMVGAMKTIVMEGGMVNSIIDSMSNRKPSYFCPTIYLHYCTCCSYKGAFNNFVERILPFLTPPRVFIP